MNQYVKLQQEHQKTIIPCEICGGNDLKDFQKYGRVAEPGVYGELPIAICCDCGFKMQNPRYEDEFYKQYYDLTYREVAFGAAKPSDEYIEQQKRRGRKVLEFAKKHGIKKGKMLDHGCASGATMLSWAEDGWECQGIDPHRPSVEQAKYLNLDVKVGSGESLPFEDESFDLILSLGSFEHSYNLDLSMSEARRVLKPEGKLLIRWRSNEIFGSPLEYYNHNHYRFFTRNTWELCLRRYGFSTDLMSNERVEGWDSYEYIVAVKKPEGSIKGDMDSWLAEGIKDDCAKELEEVSHVRKRYYEACNKYLTLQNEYKDPVALMDYVGSGRAGFKWGWLGGKPEDVVARSTKEARLYVREYDAGHVE